MAHDRLKGCRVAVLATDGFEQSELEKPVAALTKEGAEVEIVAPKEGDIHAETDRAKGIAACWGGGLLRKPIQQPRVVLL
ncbi:MAG: hypothetical protein AB7L65_03500 [Hyphomonadaceae bacterium]